MRPRLSPIYSTLLALAALVAALAVACAPSATPTSTPSPTPTRTPTPTQAAGVTPSPTSTPTRAATATAPGPTPTATPRPTPTATPTQAVTPTGRLNVIQNPIPPPIFRVSTSGQGFADALLTRLGVYEPFLRADYSAPPNYGPLGSDGIGTSWDIAPDGSKITFKVRSGVQFHGGYGEVTAQDVEFSFNDAMKEGSLFTRAARENTWTQRWEAIDQRTVVLHLKFLDPQWEFHLSNKGDTTTPIVSKKAFDTLGPEKFNVTDAGTGPFKVVRWEAGNEIILEYNPDYYREPAKVQSVRYVAIPEAATQIAALETGEMDIGQVQLQFVRSTVEKIKGRTQIIGPESHSDINFAGNYWATKNRETGETVFPRPGFKPDADHPWIGDPRDPNSMERARKVRWALAMAIDRELIVQRLTDGLGRVNYSVLGFRPDQTGIWKNEWVIPYDPEGAKRLLAEAGYTQGLSLTLCACIPGGGSSPLAEAVGQMWGEIGVNVTVDKTAYDISRPRVVDRTMDIPWIWGWNYSLPDEPMGIWMRPSTGFSRGFELPDEMTDLTYANFKEVDRDKRIQNNIKLQDYLSHWMLAVPIYSSATPFIISSRVVDWKPHMAKFGFFNSPETVVLK